MSCDEVRELLIDELDGTLPAERAAAVAAHLRECGACREELEALREAEAAVRAIPRAAAQDATRKLVPAQGTLEDETLTLTVASSDVSFARMKVMAALANNSVALALPVDERGVKATLAPAPLGLGDASKVTAATTVFYC